MKTSLITRSHFVVSGAIAIAIGGSLLFTPAAFHALNGIDLGGDINLLSETRAPGGALLAAGIIIVLGAFIQRAAQTSLVVSNTIYLSYGLSRIWSLIVDGVPDNGLVIAAGLEMALGLFGVFLWLNGQRQPKGT